MLNKVLSNFPIQADAESRSFVPSLDVHGLPGLRDFLAVSCLAEQHILEAYVEAEFLVE